MSLTTETILTCDINESPDCEGTYADGDMKSFPGYEQRKSAKGMGWIYQAGKDICSKCKKQHRN